MFGSFKIIQTFHRVLTTQELQSFSKYTKCVYHSGWVIWADCEPWKKAQLLANLVFEQTDGIWRTCDFSASTPFKTQQESDSHSPELGAMSSGRHGNQAHTPASKAWNPLGRVTLSHMVTVEQHPAWEHLPHPGGPLLSFLHSPRQAVDPGGQLFKAHSVGWHGTTQLHGPRSSIFCLLI